MGQHRLINSVAVYRYIVRYKLTEFAVVAGVASRAHARQLISRALLIVQTLCDVTDACRAGASVRVHQPARVTLAPNLCGIIKQQIYSF